MHVAHNHDELGSTPGGATSLGNRIMVVRLPLKQKIVVRFHVPQQAGLELWGGETVDAGGLWLSMN